MKSSWKRKQRRTHHLLSITSFDQEFQRTTPTQTHPSHPTFQDSALVGGNRRSRCLSFHGVRWPTWCLCCYVANAVANIEFLLFCGQRPMVSALDWRKSWNHLLPVLYVVFVVPGGNCGVRAVLWPTWLCGQWCSWCSVTNMAKQWVILMNC